MARVIAQPAAANGAAFRGKWFGILVAPVVSDTDVHDKIEAALRRSAAVDARRIRVDAAGGAVTLWSSVPTWAERDAVQRAPWNAPGVTSVVNRIVVMP